MIKSKHMTDKEKINYMRIGLGLAGVVVNNLTSEIIVRIYEGIQKKGGKFSLDDATDIEFNVTEKHNKSIKKAKVKSRKK